MNEVMTAHEVGAGGGSSVKPCKAGSVGSTRGRKTQATPM